MSFWFSVTAVGFAAFAIVLWLATQRPATMREGEGVVLLKSFQAAHTVARQPAAPPRGSMSASQDIHYGDRYLLTIRLDSGAQAVAVVPPAGAEKFPIGKRVRIKYQVRGISPFWRKILVYETQAVEH